MLPKNLVFYASLAPCCSIYNETEHCHFSAVNDDLAPFLDHLGLFVDLRLFQLLIRLFILYSGRNVTSSNKG